MFNEGILRIAAVFALIAALAFSSFAEPENGKQRASKRDQIYQVQLLGHIRKSCPVRFGEPPNKRIDCIRRARGTFAGSTVFVRTAPDEDPRNPYTTWLAKNLGME